MFETTFRITNTNLGLILPYTAVYMPIPLFIMYGDTDRAGGISFNSGCSRFMIFQRYFIQGLMEGSLKG